MSEPAKKMIFTMMLIIGVLVALVAAGTATLYYFGDRSPDPRLAESVQSEYSFPVDVRIISTSEGNVPYIVPGEVKWDSGHQRLLYNLSNPKETTLAIIESLANQDVQAIDILMTQRTKNTWSRKNYNTTQIIEEYRLKFKNIDKPYVFGLEPGEDDPSEDMLSVIVKWDLDEMRLELHKQSDGTWKI